VPTVILESWSLKSGRWFEHQTAQLDELAQRGVKRLVMHTLPHPHHRRNNCAHFDYSIADYEGGMPALRAFTDAAQERGIEVYGWGCGSLFAKADLIKQHPDWTIQNADGRRFHGGYPGTLFAVDFGNHEFQDWYVDQLSALHTEGGIAGMWLDSWMNLHAFGIDQQRQASYGGPGPHLDGLLTCLRRLSDRGMRFITDGVSPFGLSAGNLSRDFTKEAAQTGNIDFNALVQGWSGDVAFGQTDLLYRTALWWRGHHRAGGAGLSTEDYFGGLANKGPIALYDRTTDHPPSKLGKVDLAPLAFENYAEMNQAYLRVLPYMQQRELIPGAVLWHGHNNGNRTIVIFTKSDQEIALGSYFAQQTPTVVMGEAGARVADNGNISVQKHSIVMLEKER
jgi:hypothetical protein